MQTARTLVWIVVAVNYAAGSFDARAQTIALVPKSSTLPYVINGDEIITAPGAIVDLEFTFTGWGQAPGNPNLGAVIAAVNSQGFQGANAQPPNPGVNLVPLGYALPNPNGGTRHLGCFVVQSVCSMSGRDCTATQIPTPAPCDIGEGPCVANPRWIPTPSTGWSAITGTISLNYEVAALDNAAPWGIQDLGEPDHGYLGTLRLTIPFNATGTYTIDLVDSINPSSFWSDSDGLAFPFSNAVAARITIAQPAPTAAPAPYDVPANRYVSFVPAGGGVGFGAYEIRLASSTFNPGAVGFTGWLGAVNGPSSVVQANPVFRIWNEPVVHVGDCEIQPGATYEIRFTEDGILFSQPLVIATAAKPAGKDWGDVAGGNTGLEWTPPNGIANVNDILAIRSFITASNPAPTFYRSNIQFISAIDPCLNWFVNTGDLFAAVLAVNGQPYPFVTNPAMCPVCP